MGGREGRGRSVGRLPPQHSRREGREEVAGFVLSRSFRVCRAVLFTLPYSPSSGAFFSAVAVGFAGDASYIIILPSRLHTRAIYCLRSSSDCDCDCDAHSRPPPPFPSPRHVPSARQRQTSTPKLGSSRFVSRWRQIRGRSRRGSGGWAVECGLGGTVGGTAKGGRWVGCGWVRVTVVCSVV